MAIAARPLIRRLRRHLLPQGEKDRIVLILSSFVAASAVGGGMQAAALAEKRFAPVLVPSVLYGRHPGLGAPGGGPVADDVFEGVLAGIEAEGVFSRAAAVICGYFASAGQVAAAARTIDAVRAASPGARVVVDPIMGDAGKGLYVSEAVADAIAQMLVPRADLITPNAWELERLAGPGDALAAARALGRPVLVSSVDRGAEIGVIWADTGEAWLAVHARVAEAQNGAGDLLTALFTAALVNGAAPREALEAAVGQVAESLVAGPVRMERHG
jgi:pyridoxine kinase